MNRLIKKAGVLVIVFIAAMAVYFIWIQRTTEKEDSMVYTSMEEAALPVVYAYMFGKNMNILHGYTQDMRNTTARECLTVLPKDRALNIHIAQYVGTITGIQYEIRSLDLSRLVERTSLADWSTEGGEAIAVLPIQNLLAKEEEYLLTLFVETKEHGIIQYYSRIMWSDNKNIEEMINFAVDFTNRTFDYEQARELVTYLETNSSEDNSSLGHVTIRSSFSQITWGGLSMTPVGDIRITLKELDGIMGNIQLEYMVKRAGDNGITEFYEVTDNFTLKWDTQRIYLMDFERKTDQIFSGQKHLFQGKRILLGITNEDEVRSVKSPDGNHIAFIANRDLWSYNHSASGDEAVKIFSFRSGKDDGIRGGYSRHDIKILSVADTGDVDFLVYGYMNRGIHEGSMGIAMYHFSNIEDAIQERFFIPVTSSYEALKLEVEQLAYLGANDMLYLMVNQAVFGIDLNSKESMVLADALSDGNYAVSDSGNRLAWQEGSELYGSGMIYLMDLDTGEKKNITGKPGDIMRTLGFVGEDFIYGMAREGDQWVKNGRIKDLPMYALEILGKNSEIEKHYEHENSYIADVEVEDSRIHLDQVVPMEGEDYILSQEDTIVCNQSVGADPMAGIGWYASETHKKVYFVRIDQEIKGNHNIKISTPKKVAYEASSVFSLKANKELQGMVFYAYGGGHLLGTTQIFSDAVAMAHERMGVVTDNNQRILWGRVNRRALKTIKDPLMAAGKLTRNLEGFTGNEAYDNGIIMLDARGCSLNQILYFIDKGCPVAAYTSEGSYVLLNGYDQYNVSIFDPSAQSSVKMGLNDAANYFESLGNDFVCGLVTE